jgi:hypothetical protein
MQGQKSPLCRIVRHIFHPLHEQEYCSPASSQTDGGKDRSDDKQGISEPVIREIDGPSTVDNDGRSEYAFTVHIDLPREIGENARLQATVLDAPGVHSDEEWIEDQLADMIELNRVYYIDGEPLTD